MVKKRHFNPCWIVLIDISGSMGEPFSSAGAAHSFDGVVERTAERIKLDAAKKSLLKQVKALNDASLVIVAFNHVPAVVYVGAPSSEEVRQTVVGLVAGGGTDIVAALSLSMEWTLSHQELSVVRWLVISDGLSHIDDPETLARTLTAANADIVIDTILIDPTAEGAATARAISIHGDVTAVSSVAELDQAVNARSAAVHAQLSEARLLAASSARNRKRSNALFGALFVSLVCLPMIYLAQARNPKSTTPMLGSTSVPTPSAKPIQADAGARGD